MHYDIGLYDIGFITVFGAFFLPNDLRSVDRGGREEVLWTFAENSVLSLSFSCCIGCWGSTGYTLMLG